MFPVYPENRLIHRITFICFLLWTTFAGIWKRAVHGQNPTYQDAGPLLRKLISSPIPVECKFTQITIDASEIRITSITSWYGKYPIIYDGLKRTMPNGGFSRSIGRRGTCGESDARCPRKLGICALQKCRRLLTRLFGLQNGGSSGSFGFIIGILRYMFDILCYGSILETRQKTCR